MGRFKTGSVNSRFLADILFGRSVKRIIAKLCSNGFEAFLAGGAVRDILLGVTPADMDIVTNAGCQKIRALFHRHRVIEAGKSFPVCLVDGIEVATYRTFRQWHPPCSPQTALLANSLYDDLKCRDFTINSMAMCPYSGDIIDPFGGMADLKAKTIRFTANPMDRISEDPCRILRACRFLAKLDGRFDPATYTALCRSRKMVVASVAPERIRLEIMKALAYAKPSLFFQALHDIGVLADILPSLDGCYPIDGGPYHGESVFSHCLMTGDALSPKRPILRLAGYLHDTGKANTKAVRNGRMTFYGHEHAIDCALSDLRALRFSAAELAFIQAITHMHMRKIDIDTSSRIVRRLLAALKNCGLCYQDYLRLKIADRRGNLAKPDYNCGEIKRKLTRFKRELDDQEKKAALTIKDLAVTGVDVMRVLDIGPGPVVGRVLDDLIKAVLDDPTLNDFKTLIGLISSMAGKP
jgi:tRNA nucleotidyltransferase (CCA-adding enzyme)